MIGKGHLGVEENEDWGKYENERTTGAIEETITGLDSIIDLVGACLVGHFPQSGGIDQLGKRSVDVDDDHTQSQQLACRGRC